MTLNGTRNGTLDVARNGRRVRDESGQLASVEVLPFGVLLFVIGVLFFGQIWAVLESKSAVDAAAREATHVFIEGHDPAVAATEARSAALAVLEANGRDGGRAQVSATAPLTLERCARVSFEVAYRVPLVRAPLLPSWGGGFTVRAEHGAVVDPYRDGLEGGDCG